MIYKDLTNIFEFKLLHLTLLYNITWSLNQTEMQTTFIYLKREINEIFKQNLFKFW